MTTGAVVPPALHLLVVAKAPVPGQVKTRLAADVGPAAAAALAAAALLDTLAACTATVAADRCHLALAGDLGDAVRGPEILDRLDGWTVVRQTGAGLAERLAHAHSRVSGPVLQIGMDTPQVTSELLTEAAAPLADHEAVLGPAEDGGWWSLALRAPSAAAALVGVPMSTPDTYAHSRSALLATSIRVARTASLRDVDTLADAHAVALAAPGTRFAAAWREVA